MIDLAPSTLTAYAADWAAWCAWADSHDYESLPAQVSALACYLPTLHEHPSQRRILRGQSGGMRANSIARRLAAIKYYHKQAGLPYPRVEDIVAGVRRAKADLGETIRRVAPIMADTLHTVIDRIGTVSVRDKRDRALLLLCWRSALRRSELAALRRSDLTIRPGAVSVCIRRSKTDQLAAGKEIAVPSAASEERYDLAPALQAWLAVAPEGDGESPLFTSLHGSKTGAALSGDAVAEIIKLRCRKARVQGDVSGDSLRQGWFRTASLSATNIQPRRRSPLTMVAIYCEQPEGPDTFGLTPRGK